MKNPCCSSSHRQLGPQILLTVLLAVLLVFSVGTGDEFPACQRRQGDGG
jgi:hypothetical protein